MITDYRTPTQTSEELHIVRSTLSSQVKLLEEEYNVPPFIRRSKRLELTRLGGILYSTARQVIHRKETTYRDINCLLNGMTGTVRIRLAMVYPDFMLSNILTSFKAVCPRVGYSIFEWSSEEITRPLIQNKIDVDFAKQQKALPPLARKELMIKQKFHVCYAEGSPWVSEDVGAVSIRGPDNTPLAVPRIFENVLQLSLQKLGIHPNVICVSGSRFYTVILARTVAGIGVICISGVKDLTTQGVPVRPLTDIGGEKDGNVSAGRCVIVSTKCPLSSATTHFVSFYRENILYFF